MDELRLGSAVEDITPGPELDLLGYAYRQERLPPGNAGAIAPLQARCLVLADAQGPAVICSLDLCILSPGLAAHLRRSIADAVATDPDRVLLACTHTHSGPWLPDAEVDAYVRSALPVEKAASTQEPAAAYLARLECAVRAAAARAAGLLVPVQLRWRQADAGLGYARRVSGAQGMQHCWNPSEQVDLRPAAPADQTLSVLVFEQQGGPARWLLWALGVHPVVLGKTSRVVSPDYPGVANALLESWETDCRAQFLLGPAGDVHPWIATQGDPDQVMVVARAAAAQVALLARSGGRPVAATPLRIASLTRRVGQTELALSVWRIGVLRLIAAPVELFSSLGATLRARIDGPVVIVSNANGWTGYWADASAYDHPQYEIAAGRSWNRERGDGEQLVEALVELAEAV
ncbi:MAG: neutral/alkaline non-lysosomal ceramidase N-terminal domain-containing protein [Planctomycetota bacterium]